MINGYGVNGAYQPAWVVRAVVVAVAAAATLTAVPTRVALASAYGNANVSVTINDLYVINASASATAGAPSSSVTPRVKRAGRVLAAVDASGFALVIRLIPAQAGGDAAASGTALPNAKIGDASSTSLSSVVLCKAHRIRPAASYTLASASSIAPVSKVTRYSPAPGQADATGRAEASTKLSGQSFFRHDGFVINALSFSTALVDQSKTKLIATLGAFDFANGTGVANPFIRYTAGLFGPSSSVSAGALARRVQRGVVFSLAECTALAPGVRTRTSPASGNAEAVLIKAAIAQRHAASAIGSGGLSVVSLNASRRAVGAVYAPAEASSLAIVTGRQFFAVAGGIAEATALPASIKTNALASGLAECSGLATRATQHYATINQPAEAFSAVAPAGTQHRQTAFGLCASQGFPVEAKHAKFGALASGVATSYLVVSSFGTQHRSSVNGVAASSIVSTTPISVKYLARADASSDAFLVSILFGTQHRATAQAIAASQKISAFVKVSSKAFGLAQSPIAMATGATRSDEPAPDERQMSLPGEERIMLVPSQDRTMVITS